MKFIPIVLSGGAGTRLWPVSREGRPKPFMKLADGETLIQKTYDRIKALSSEVVTVTNRDYYFMSRDELDRVKLSGKFLLEPFGKNTAPAIALAAHSVASTHGADAIMLVLSADHLIANQAAFEAGVAEAAQMANQDYLVTFGIVPTSPETGFGYIQKGHDFWGGFQVASFVEKPDIETAKAYVASGNYLWNSGMFCFKAGVFLEELTKYAPEVAKTTLACWKVMQINSSSSMIEIPEDLFNKVPDISVDYAVMEQSDKVAVIPSSFDWNDIGSWSSIKELVKPDACENRALGEAIFVDSHNTFIQSEDRLVAAVGVCDIMIIDTVDALLVASADKAQDVKKVVAQLKKNRHDSLKLHRTVTRPWGTYTVLQETSNFKIKRIEVIPGGRLSLQKHHHRSEHWVVVSGQAKITNGNNQILIQKNESTFIPAGQIHRLENPGELPCIMIEVQCGSYLGEDDIVRIEDQYGR